MEDFPTITRTKSFKVTKLVVVPSQLEDKKYVIGHSAMSVALPDF